MLKHKAIPASTALPLHGCLVVFLQYLPVEDQLSLNAICLICIFKEAALLCFPVCQLLKQHTVFP